ncbi:MAG: hypothetical protein ACTH58_01470 [Marinomonas foliarum]|jgi:hypothetical protein|uniref:Uncharacterized protein n=1 Tax=Marinomonas foliarum TaxID=491950 RepID=A0A368ZRD6_9GAMM|nr:hypothetical protein [Marinomonas foliarum]QRV23569.1 hypothetical protein JSY38_16265 [Marinomonas foliarum]RCW98566.1 hypothetical protein DFP77_12735 [Marinomonas foliarum]
MNKKQLLNTYKKIDSFNEKKVDSSVKPAIYRSEYDERLIKDFHYAKFQKNLQNAQKSDTLKALLNKEDWSEEDTNTLLESLR